MILSLQNLGVILPMLTPLRHDSFTLNPFTLQPICGVISQVSLPAHTAHMCIPLWAVHQHVLFYSAGGVGMLMHAGEGRARQSMGQLRGWPGMGAAVAGCCKPCHGRQVPERGKGVKSGLIPGEEGGVAGWSRANLAIISSCTEPRPGHRPGAGPREGPTQ